MRRCGWIASLVVARTGIALAQPEAEPAWQYDPENAREVMETCAGCHGRSGEGGKGGSYPRIAGLEEEYIARQLRAFKARERVNIPMYQYTTDRELPESDIRDVSRLLAAIELPTELPPMDASMSALERLLAAQAVFSVPPVDGDIERGAALYDDECSECHGPEGWGEDDAPQLAGQYTSYLRRQIEAFQSGERVNEDMEGVFESLDPDDVEDIFAYLAAQD